jgi:hypothetical protein
MSCKQCGNYLIKLSVKCYDNVSLSSEDPRLVDYGNLEFTYKENLGFTYDGKVLELSYCLQCGKVDNTFPVAINESKKLESPTVYIGEMIKKFYDYVMLGDTKHADKLMRQLSVRMSPSDVSTLVELWGNYEGIKNVYPRYMEFDECVNEFVDRYKKYQFI